jgi:nucleoside-diphosphate-sugar epimerase
MGGTEADERVLVLGATSLVGRRLLPRLVRGGAPVVALSRDPPADGEGARWVRGSLADPALDLPAAGTVFSLMPLWLLPEALPRLAAGGMTRLVAFSSTSRFTKLASPEPSERATAQSLADAEAGTVAACEAAGAAWTILRPTLIYSEGEDRNVSRLAALIARLGVLPLAGRGEGRRQPVHADDLAAAALAAAASPAARDRAYDLPGGETLTYREMAVRIFEALDRRPRILSVPPALWRLGLKLASPALPGATAAMGARMSEDLVFDPAPAARDFGWAPRGFRPDFGSVAD